MAALVLRDDEGCSVGLWSALATQTPHCNHEKRGGQGLQRQSLSLFSQKSHDLSSSDLQHLSG